MHVTGALMLSLQRQKQPLVNQGARRERQGSLETSLLLLAVKDCPHYFCEIISLLSVSAFAPSLRE